MFVVLLHQCGTEFKGALHNILYLVLLEWYNVLFTWLFCYSYARCKLLLICAVRCGELQC